MYLCIKRCDLWKRRVVNKHHQQSCCGQNDVCTYVVGGRMGMNDTCYFSYFSFDLKMRLAFILTVNLHVTPADRGEIVLFSHVKCAWASF